MANVEIEQLDGRVARITLSRPEAMNAIDRAMQDELEAAMQSALKETAIRAIVLTGAGKHFSAGGDIGFLRKIDATSQPRYSQQLIEFVKLLAGSPKPVVAAVSGACAGGSVGFALACDYVVASHSARFVVPFLKIGLPPDMGVGYLLAQRVGLQQARRLVFDGRVVEASEAIEMGLIDTLVTDDELQEEALILARRLALLPPLAFAATKRLMGQCGGDLDAFLVNEVAATRNCSGSSEFVEGTAAFLEKREPFFA